MLPQDIQAVDKHICADCERLLEDDSPSVAVSAFEMEPRSATGEITGVELHFEVRETEPVGGPAENLSPATATRRE